MPADPEVRHEIRTTGRTHAEAWEAISHLERVAYCRSGEFELRLTGHGMLVQVERAYVPRVVQVATDRPTLIDSTGRSATQGRKRSIPRNAGRCSVQRSVRCSIGIAINLVNKVCS
jgi:hypothetical protein